MLRKASLFAAIAVLGACAAEEGEESLSRSLPQEVSSIKAWRFASVGVADLDAALALWRDQFGFEVIHERQGSDPGLEKLWGLPAGAIARQALVSGTLRSHGRLILVEFTDALPPVREDAELYDSLPKNLDVYSNALSDHMRQMQEAGHVFRHPTPQQFEASGVTIEEAQLPAHDETNIVIMQRSDITEGFNRSDFAGLGLIVYAAEDVEREETFLADVLGVETLHAVELGGPELEAMTGLAPGTRWHIRIVGDPGSDFGQIEVIDYRGVEGKNRFERARPGATGLFEVTYESVDLDAVERRLQGAGHDVDRVDNAAFAGLCVDALRFRSPAGMPIMVFAETRCPIGRL